MESGIKGRAECFVCCRVIKAECGSNDNHEHSRMQWPGIRRE